MGPPQRGQLSRSRENTCDFALSSEDGHWRLTGNRQPSVTLPVKAEELLALLLAEQALAPIAGTASSTRAFSSASPASLAAPTRRSGSSAPAKLSSRPRRGSRSPGRYVVARLRSKTIALSAIETPRFRVIVSIDRIIQQRGWQSEATEILHRLGVPLPTRKRARPI